MRKCLIVILLLGLQLPLFGQTAPPVIAPKPVTEEYFGVKITDPYRNVENLEDPEVKAWMKAQAEQARNTLDAIPGRQGLIDKMNEFDQRRAARITSLKILETDRYFYLKTRPQDQQPKLYYRDGYKGQETLLFDPEKYNREKAYSLNNFSPSPDGSKVAVCVSEKGAELGQIIFINTQTQTLYPERLDRAWFNGSWLPDNKTFSYTPANSHNVQDPNARLNTKAMLHTLGTFQNKDKDALSSTSYPSMGIHPEEYPKVNYDRNTKLVYGRLNTVSRYLKIYYAPASQLTLPPVMWQPLFSPEQEITSFVSDSTHIYFITSKDAPHQKVMRMPLSAIDVNKAEVVVAENPEEAIDDQKLTITKDGIYFVRTKNGVEAMLYFVPRTGGEPQKIELPQAAGSINLLAKSPKSSELWVTISGWTTDAKRYYFDLASHKFTSQPLSTEAEYPEYADMVVEEVMIPSHDGVKVPVSLIYKKGTPKNGTAPVLIYGYGAYSTSVNPAFSPSFLLWAQYGVLAIAHVRGGGELGEAWHKAGQKATKPNTWKDLIASAEYLIKNNYTGPQKIAIYGASAGGILIGRAMTERPDLFAVAIPKVGCLNAVRMEESPNGPVNVPEFGTVKKEDEYKALIEMDAYLHIKEGIKYPATLITAGFNDPRVIAWQPAKFAARLMASNKSDKPILFLTDYEAGHGIGDAKQKQFENLADVYSFGLWQTGVPNFQTVTLGNK
ncbi:prolyl oligopeptidase family serine peptidase [Cytophagaceae bacterium DM2B3-1]|uniref:prolyl oligopeptidase n=1 Tax=Xanthocytophaga flava TaxID=3048013 RepID=A0ABT7CSI2_9BACT|nr:prolyl oligopeptidase family serine peptidase [Xanthocytophaga flavus]MDJ1496677.1 prolyl oligopeptidase family serine peptidase [Xanthocytophaga flavus]